MANRRMIDKKISVSEQVADLSRDAQIIFTWAIPHADDFGLISRSPKTLKATIVPMIDMTLEHFEGCIAEIVKSGLWVEGEYEGQSFYHIAKFSEHQTLKKDRTPNTILNSVDTWLAAEELGLTSASQQRSRQRLENLFEEHISKNLSDIEAGLVLVKRQYQLRSVGNQFVRVDILARDKKGTDVLIEIKVNDVQDQTVLWQAKDQRTWYETQEKKKPRCIVVAPYFTDKVEEYATKEEIEIFRMELPVFQVEEKETLSKEKRSEVKISKEKRKGGARDSLFKKQVETSFEEFWKEYPNKKAKKKALELWLKIEPNGEMVHAMMKALREQVKSKQWQKDGGAYIPHPTTWLNQERWTDEVAPDVSRKTTDQI